MNHYRITLDLEISSNAAHAAMTPDERLKEVTKDAQRMFVPVPRLHGASWRVLSVEEVS